MAKIRCQVCGGPVAKGRCKYCGMPYRNDEVLYHLNENRRDHYTHATEKAKQAMRQMEIPLGDKNNTKGNIKTKEEVKKQQQAIRQEAEKRIKSTKPQNMNTSTYKPKGAASGGQKKKSKASTWITVIIFIVIILSSIWPNIVDYVKEKIRYYTDSSYGQENTVEDIYIQDYADSIYNQDYVDSIYGQDYEENIYGQDFLENLEELGSKFGI